MWLSYIIPLYNCGPWISECLDSLLRQGLEEELYEVIVVNDGSTDDGPAIVEQYCRKYPNFRLVNQENQGVGSARNRGIDEAQGEYLWFVDADDWIATGGGKLLYDIYMENNRNTAIYMFKYHCVSNEKIKDNGIKNKDGIDYKGNVLKYCQSKNFIYPCNNKLIPKLLITKSNLRFPPYMIDEDILFVINLYLSAQDAQIVETGMDIYMVRPRINSITRNQETEHRERLLYDRIKAIIAFEQIISKENVPKCFVDAIRKRNNGIKLLLVLQSLPYRLYAQLLQKACNEGLYPIENPQGLRQKIVNILSKRPYVAYWVGLFYQRIYITHIKPVMARL